MVFQAKWLVKVEDLWHLSIEESGKVEKTTEDFRVKEEIWWFQMHAYHCSHMAFSSVVSRTSRGCAQCGRGQVNLLVAPDLQRHHLRASHRLSNWAQGMLACSQSQQQHAPDPAPSQVHPWAQLKQINTGCKWSWTIKEKQHLSCYRVTHGAILAQQSRAEVKFPGGSRVALWEIIGLVWRKWI